MTTEWQTKTLGALCRIELGRTPARAVEAYWDESRQTGNVWLSIADLLNAKDNVVVDSKEYLSDIGASASKIVARGTLLVSFKLTLGRLAFAGRDLFTNEAIAALTIFDERQLSKEFLYWFLQSFDWRKAAESDVKLKGMTLNKAKLREMPVHFPPPDEQKRIVALLDEAFAAIAVARTNTDQNLRNAREAFGSYLNGVFTQRGGTWVERPLGAVCSFENGDRGTNYPSRSARTAAGIPFINAGHLTDDGIDLENMDYISRERFDLLSNGKIRPGDILFCLRGSLGKVAGVGGLSQGAIASSLVIVRPGKMALTEYVLSYFRSCLCSQAIDRFKNGAAQPNLSARSLGCFPIPVPSLPEQAAVVESVAKVGAETRRLASVYERKLAALDALKQSLLHQAFTGVL